MSDITLHGSQPPIGRLSIEPTEDGTRVRLSFVADAWPTEVVTSFTLSLADAEAASGMLSDAIEEVSETIESLEEDVRSKPQQPAEDEPVLVGELPF